MKTNGKWLRLLTGSVFVVAAIVAGRGQPGACRTGTGGDEHARVRGRSRVAPAAAVQADTGAFKRAWGAFGNAPIDVLPAPAAAGQPGGGRGGAQAQLDTEGPGSPAFASPVHGIQGVG